MICICICDSLLFPIWFIFYGLLISYLHNLNFKNYCIFESIQNIYGWSITITQFLLLLIFSIYPIKTIQQITVNSTITTWTLDFVFIYLLMLIFTFYLMYSFNSNTIGTICDIFFCPTIIGGFFYFYEENIKYINGSTVNKNFLIGIILFILIVHLYFWLPHIVNWSTTHCFLDDSLPEAVSNPASILIVLNVTLIALIMVDHLWRHSNHIILNCLMTYIIIYNITTGFALLSISIIYFHMPTFKNK
jgi:hypothetical protein